MDALIFDVDGTLWDSTDRVAYGWRRAFLAEAKEANETLSRELNKAAKTLDGARLKSEFGKPMKEIFEDLLPGVQLDACFDALLQRCYAEQDAALLEQGGILYPGVQETLPVLEKKLPLYIVSNCQKGYIERFLQCTGLRSCFKGWLCYGDTGKEKDVTLTRLLQKEALNKTGVMYIGDTDGDANSCIKAGIPFIWASYGFGKVQPDKYQMKIDVFSELLSLQV